MAVAWPKVTAPTLPAGYWAGHGAASVSGLHSAVPQEMVQPRCPDSDDKLRKIQPWSPRLF